MCSLVCILASSEFGAQGRRVNANICWADGITWLAQGRRGRSAVYLRRPGPPGMHMDGQGSGQEGCQAIGAWGLLWHWERAGPWALWTDRLCRSQESAGATLHASPQDSVNSTNELVSKSDYGETSRRLQPLNAQHPNAVCDIYDTK